MPPSPESVAEVYLAACREGRPPTRAVAEHFGCAHSTAARWVGAARQAGALAETIPGRAPVLNQRVLRVAADLGVDPAKLQESVRRHGPLRVS